MNMNMDLSSKLNIVIVLLALLLVMTDIVVLKNKYNIDIMIYQIINKIKN